jgi:hypothetical protein
VKVDKKEIMKASMRRDSQEDKAEENKIEDKTETKITILGSLEEITETMIETTKTIESQEDKTEEIPIETMIEDPGTIEKVGTGSIEMIEERGTITEMNALPDNTKKREKRTEKGENRTEKGELPLLGTKSWTLLQETTDSTSTSRYFTPDLGYLSAKSGQQIEMRDRRRDWY